jgi:hypothetical protein
VTGTVGIAGTVDTNCINCGSGSTAVDAGDHFLYCVKTPRPGAIGGCASERPGLGAPAGKLLRIDSLSVRGATGAPGSQCTATVWVNGGSLIRVSMETESIPYGPSQNLCAARHPGGFFVNSIDQFAVQIYPDSSEVDSVVLFVLYSLVDRAP